VPRPRKSRDDIRIVRGRDGKTVLLIKERYVKVPYKEVMLLACLADNLGRVVSYENLLRNLGYKLTPKTQHLLRQYVTALRKLLLQHKLNVALVVSREFGYGLCKIARG
jgi:DNA-binding response OmpR family regulator